jgi:hypothetical protein
LLERRRPPYRHRRERQPGLISIARAVRQTVSEQDGLYLPYLYPKVEVSGSYLRRRLVLSERGKRLSHCHSSLFVLLSFGWLSAGTPSPSGSLSISVACGVDALAGPRTTNYSAI